MLGSASQALILSLALTGEAGFIAPKDVETVHKSILQRLPERARSTVMKRFPKARLVASCHGSFTQPGAADVAITLLDGPIAGDGGDLPQVLRVVLLADGSLVSLPWTEGPDWSYSGSATLDDRGLFYGELECLPAGQAKTFAKSFLDGFLKPKPAAQVDLQHLGSICFAFDDTYNNWQCFAYRQQQRDFTRWGYQATAD
jgi:hypothetical protein